MNREQNIRALQAIAEKIGYEARVFPGGSSVAFSNIEIPATVKFEMSEEGLIYPYIYVRTTSWDLPGERTDTNEIFSVLIAAFLRVNNYASCRILDIPHPAMEVPDTEIYARYLVPEQSHILAVQLDDQSLDKLEKFCFAIRYLCLIIPRLLDWDTTKPYGYAADSNYNYQEAEEWAETVADIVGERFNYKIQFCQRINPCWQHYRSIQTRLTVYYSPQLSSSLISLLADNKPWKNISISTGNVYDSGDIINFISLRESGFVERILKGLNNTRHLNEIAYIPLENIFIAASGNYVTFLEREASRKRFEYEREKARDKHSKDAEILFPISEFTWNLSIDGSRFEAFIMDLLKLENQVLWVRQVSSTNEPDRGKDIICDWLTQPPVQGYLDEKSPPYVIRRVIVQCKAFKNAVPKSKVTDIRDTVEHHDADGFFLAVSSHLGNTLTEHLYKMRTDGKIWIDWWTRSEIEERLRIHRHIVSKYPDIVQLKYSQT